MRSFNHVATLIKDKRTGHPKRYSQLELSELLGYKNGQFISNVERALCNVPLKMIGKVCEILSIEHEEFKRACLKDYEETLEMYLKQDLSMTKITRADFQNVDVIIPKRA